MAHAGKIINGWIGVNLTNKEAKELVGWWNAFTEDMDLTEMAPDQRERYRAAANAIIQIEKAL